MFSEPACPLDEFQALKSLIGQLQQRHLAREHHQENCATGFLESGQVQILQDFSCSSSLGDYIATYIVIQFGHGRLGSFTQMY